MPQIVLTQSDRRAGDRRPVGGRVAQAFGRLPPTALLLLSLGRRAARLGLGDAAVFESRAAGTGIRQHRFFGGRADGARAAEGRPQAARACSDHSALRPRRHLHGAALLLALERIPLGVASAITFLGPLGIAVATSRRLLHFLWIGIATLGIGLLTPAIGGDLDPLGLGLAALAAAGWAGFVPLSKLGAAPSTASTVLLLPFALAEGSVLRAGALEFGAAAVVALLSAVLPMALEYRALQRMSARTYGILVTLEPAIGALIGAVCLGQPIGPRLSIAVACVTIAALGVTLSERRDGRN